MNIRSPHALSPQATAVKAACLAAFLSSPAIAQDCETVEFTSSNRSQEVEVGPSLRQSDTGLPGVWSDYLSTSRMHPFDMLRRSIARTSHYSDLDPDRSEVFLSGRAESSFHPSAARSDLFLGFDVESVWQRDLTDDYGTGQSALEMACGPYDYWFGSSTHMMMWIEQETRSSQGELVDDPDRYPNIVDLWHVEDGLGECLETGELFLEQVHPGTANYWTDVRHRDRLPAGKYTLDMVCSVLADPPSFLSGVNAGTSDLTVLLEFEDRGLGSGDSNLKSLERRCTAKIRHDDDEVASSSDRDGRLQATRTASGVTVESSEDVLVEETSFWGRHTAVVEKGATPVAGRIEAVAETVVEMTFHDDVSVELTMNGIFTRKGRGASAVTSIEIRDSSGGLVWADRMRAITDGHGSIDPYTDLTASSAITSPGRYTIRITTTARLLPLVRTQGADIDCSFAILVNELP